MMKIDAPPQLPRQLNDALVTAITRNANQSHNIPSTNGVANNQLRRSNSSYHSIPTSQGFSETFHVQDSNVS